MKKFTFLSAITASVILLAPAASQARDHNHNSRGHDSHERYESSRSGCDSGRGYDNRGYDYHSSRGGYDPRYDGNRGSCDSGRGYQQGPSRGGYSHGSSHGGFRGPIGLPGFLSGIFGGQRSCR